MTSLTQTQMFDQITMMMRGEMDEDSMISFLQTLSMRGETADEITGAAMALRSFATTITAPENAIDCCGTGGDGAHTFNISTAVALVCAACGVPVAKHGNRASSSKSGAADVLEKLGVPLDYQKEKLERALREIGFCFLMAPNHHAAMRHVAAARKKMGTRTIFNLLGPLANPAGTKKQLIGVYDKKWIMPMITALKSLGTQKAMVVHGSDGLDEITLCGDTKIALLENGTITQKTLTPDDFGLPWINQKDIVGGDAATNAKALLGLLNGDKSAYRDIVLANAAAALYLHDGRPLKDGVADAATAIDTGNAMRILNNYKNFI